jgi:hypothetical protein
MQIYTINMMTHTSDEAMVAVSDIPELFAGALNRK